MIYITLINCAIVTDCVYDCNCTLYCKNVTFLASSYSHLILQISIHKSDYLQRYAIA